METGWFAGTGADLERIAQQTASAFENKQELRAVVENIGPEFDQTIYDQITERAGLTEDEEDYDSQFYKPEERKPRTTEQIIRSLPEYDRLLWSEVARGAAKADAAKILAGEFTGFEGIGTLPDPPDPILLVVTGKDNISTSVVGPRTVTVLSGHRASGKTWISAVWASQVIRAGGHVIWIDFERQPHGLSQKLRSMGLQSHLIDRSLHYTNRLPSVERLTAAVKEYAVSGKPVLLVVDAFRGLQNTLAPDASANDGDAVEKVYLSVLNPCAEAGATICLLDHLAKSGNGSTFGSERKESAADYVIRVEQQIPFTKTAAGFSVLEVTKDRYGVIAAGTPAGYLWMPGDGKQSGKGIDKYPHDPELRAWSPHEAADAAATELSQKGQRELAITTVVRDNPLAFGPRPLGVAVHEVYADLFETPKAATDFASRMRNEGKLVKEDGRDGKYDLPAGLKTPEDVAKLLNAPWE